MSTFYPVLGEQFKIGDIIHKEKPNFESRKLVLAATSQTIFKGQVLSGNAALGQTVTKLVTAGVQTITLSGATSGGSGSLAFRYRGAQSADLTAANLTGASAATNIQAALRATHPDLGNVTVTDPSAYLVITITSPTPLVESIEVVNDSLATSGSAAITTDVIVSTADPQPTCIALQAVTTNSSSPSVANGNQILVLYREAMVNPGYLKFLPNGSGVEQASAAQIAAFKQLLEDKQFIITLGGPNYNSSQDVVGVEAGSTEEVLVTPTIDVPGL